MDYLGGNTMKKILSIAVALVMMLSVVALVACDNSETYTGSYSYEAYGLTYGAKVDVVMTGDTISNLRLYPDDETNWIGLSDAYPDYGWTDDNRQVWLDGVNNLMLSFVGMTADEVAAIDATIAGVNGTADSVDGDYNITGATQSSARLVLAIQNAICDGPSAPEVSDEDTSVTYTGSATGTVMNNDFTINVTVTVDDDKVTSVTIDEGSETNYSWSTTVTEDALDTLTASFVGMTVAEVLAVESATVTTDGSATGDHIITGATITSNTVLTAVQDALTEDGDSYTGSASGSYGNSFDVSVTVVDGTITAIVIEDSSVTGTYDYDKTFDAGSATLIETLVGMSIVDVMAIEGSPVVMGGQTVDEYVVTGATDSSNAFLDAVQDALSSLAD